MSSRLPFSPVPIFPGLWLGGDILTRIRAKNPAYLSCRNDHFRKLLKDTRESERCLQLDIL